MTLQICEEGSSRSSIRVIFIQILDDFSSGFCCCPRVLIFVDRGLSSVRLEVTGTFRVLCIFVESFGFVDLCLLVG